MKTLNVTEATFEAFKAAKIQIQAERKEEMSDSFALSAILEEWQKKAESTESCNVSKNPTEK
jgi:hypothetical protein